MTDADCICSHPAHWHLKHASGRDPSTIRLSRCLAKVKNERGFPTACKCKSFKAKVKVTA
jgi:hypothetical protein